MDMWPIDSEALKAGATSALGARDARTDGERVPADFRRPRRQSWSTMATRIMSASTHWPGLFVSANNSGAKLVWQSTHAMWNVLLNATGRR